MAAAATDYFIKATPVFSTTIGSGGVADGVATTIPLSSVTSLPTDTGIELVINRVDSGGTVTNNYETVRGVISGSNLTNCVRGVEGTAQAWSAGVVVECLMTADMQNRMVTGITTAIEQTGRVKNEQWYAADSVGSDSYAVTLSPVPAAYTTGMVVNFKAGTANTGACTLNVNSLGAKTIKKLNDQDTATGDIESGQIVTVIYDGTNFQMQSQTAQSQSIATDTIWDAKGDIVAATAADTAARVAVGANKKILEADSGATPGVKWASFGINLALVSAYLSSDTSALTNNTPTKLVYDNESFDVGGNYATGTFTVPTGYAGYYEIYAQAYMYTSLVDQTVYRIYIYKNGSSIAERRVVESGTSAPMMPNVSALVHLNATDTIEIYVESGSGNNLVKVFGSTTLSYFYIKQVNFD